MYDVKDLQRAIELVTKAHAGHTDRNGVPYIYHLFYVSAAMDAIDGKILGLLHDSVEDGKLTHDQIHAEFGDPMSTYVEIVTRATGETYSHYITRVMTFEITARMKLADIEHNTLVDRMDAKAAQKFPMYRDAYEEICKYLGIPNRHFISSTPDA
jgi:(p)ppGpp synthase/HD superfamily hydrolase